MIEQKRAKNVALFGAGAYLAFLVLIVLVSRMTFAPSTLPMVVFLGGGLPLWLMVAVRFYCRQLASQEEHELAELAASQARSTTMFEGGSDIEGRPAARRLALFDKWGTPIFTIFWAAYHAVLGLIVLRWLGEHNLTVPKNGQQAAMFTLLAAFVAFLLSRYATGMSAHPAWRTLRPAGSYLLMSALLLGAQTVSFVLGDWQQMQLPDRLVCYAATIVQLVLAAELLINLLLDLYRPRVAGREDRLSYDSRLLGLLAEPQRVGHSIAETLNYQFGFEVSKTWFYRLVATAFVPLLVAGLAALFAMSALVYVPAGNVAVVMRWGQVDRNRPTLSPGLRTKLPWPFETVRQFDVTNVNELSLGVKGGSEAAEDSEPLQPGQRRMKLWQKAHGIEGHVESDFLVPLRPLGGGVKDAKAGEPVLMTVAKIAVSVRYRIRDVYHFGFGVTDGQAMLQSLADREVLRFCSATPFFDDQINDRQTASGGLQATAEDLRRRLQQAADDRELGVEIVGVGFPAIHPPETTAQSYEAVLGAESKAEAALHEARAQADAELSAAAGSPLGARLLALSIRKADLLAQLSQSKTPEAFDKLITDQVIDTPQVKGRVAEDIERFGQEKAQADRMGRREDVALAATMLEANQTLRDEWTALRADRRAGKAIDLEALARKAQEEAQDRLTEAAGEAATKLADARAFRWRREISEGAVAREFARESLPYANPAVRSVYLTDRICATWEKILPQAFKYVIGVDPNRIESRLNYERSQRPFINPAFGADNPAPK